MGVREAKILGGVGSILSLVGMFVPKVGWIVSIIGFVLLYLGYKKISEATGRSEIISSFIIAVVLAIVSAIIIAFGGTSAMLGIFSMMGHGRGGLLALGIILFILAWIIAIVAYFFYKKALDTTNEATNISSFKTAGLLMFIGAILMIVVVGFIIIIVGRVFEIIAFFSLPDTLG
ncbi:MAG: DUF996 domain-containing protein [Caldisericia bacterium]|jgi:uncharacterized membrane protein|nr:DUF996 domain-containing protein [Caldisericia bacterium]